MPRPTVREPSDLSTPVARTTVTSFRIIDAMAGRTSVGVSELADELSIQKGTVHKHLSTLERVGYVVKTGRQYRLSLGFLELGASVRAGMSLYNVAHGPLTKLSEATEKTASIMIREGNWGVYLTRVMSEERTQMDLFEGERVPLPATAGGKAILAYLSADDREAVFDEFVPSEYTKNTISDREALDAELQAVRDNRLAHDRGEYDSNRHCIAAPITDRDDDPVGAVTISGPAEQMREESSQYDFPSFVASTATSIQNKVLQ